MLAVLIALGAVVLGTGVARAGTWTGNQANAYRISYAVCRTSSPAKIARTFHFKTKDWAEIAERYGYRSFHPYQAGGTAGCIDGFLKRRPVLAHTWP